MINKNEELILSKIIWCVKHNKDLKLSHKNTKKLMYFIDNLIESNLKLQLELSQYDMDLLDNILDEVV